MDNQPNRPGIVAVDVRSPSATRYTSTASTPKSPNLCKCIGEGLMVTIASLAYLAIRVSSICFFISGAVFLSEEYTDIPDCAKSYRGWGIAMTVICVIQERQHVGVLLFACLRRPVAARFVSLFYAYICAGSICLIHCCVLPYTR